YPRGAMSFTFSPKRGRALTYPLRFGTVILQALGVTQTLDYDAPPEDPPWPPPESGITEARAEELLQHFDMEEPLSAPSTAAERTAFKRFAAARRAWRATRSKERGKIPEFKFGSNDGWIVSKTEARTIAKALQKVLDDEGLFSLLADVLDLPSSAD